MLRKQISDCQEYRQGGLISFSEVEKYEKDKKDRVRRLTCHTYASILFN